MLKIIILSMALFTQNKVAQAVVNGEPGRFDPTNPNLPEPWQLIQFNQKIPATHYRVIDWDGVGAIEATAAGSMALLARPVEINLQQTPVLCWRWRVEHALINADMATRQGDDYAARIYLAFDLPKNTLNIVNRAKLKLARRLFGNQVPDAALNYVWDNRYPVGTQRQNVYTDFTQMLVVRSKAAPLGQWVTERRDVLLDILGVFGSEQIQLKLLAIAADTDNTGESTRSGFADFHFRSRSMPCAF